MIDSFTQNKSEWVNSVVVLSVSASDLESGLASMPYSYDGGATWVTEPTLTVTENGTYTVLVRDLVGNTAQASLTVSNIDTAAPVIDSFTQDEFTGDDDSEVKVTLNVLASDMESDNDSLTYSYDNGNSWVAEPTCTVTKEGTYSVIVKDNAGNTSKAEMEVTIVEAKKHEPAPPVIKMVFNTLYKTATKVATAVANNPVQSGFIILLILFLLAGGVFAICMLKNRKSFKEEEDTSDWGITKASFFVSETEDGEKMITVNAENAIGLADMPYSYDDGMTWTADNTLTVSENGTYTIVIKDSIGNVTEESVEVGKSVEIEEAETKTEESETANESIIVEAAYEVEEELARSIEKACASGVDIETLEKLFSEKLTTIYSPVRN